MMVGGRVANHDRADLFKASPVMLSITREVGVRIRNGVIEWSSRSRLA
jgi:hypothetical protein